MIQIALFGDSVFAGYGLAPECGPASVLARAISGAHVVNAGVAGQTAADGLARIETISADIVLVEFGLNDSILGVPAVQTAEALATVVARLQARGAEVMLVEAIVPEGSTWPACVDHAGLIRRVASTTGASFCPDILVSVGAHFQEDGLHPAEEGARRIAVELATKLRCLVPRRS